MENQLNIKVRDSVFDPDLPKTASSKVRAIKRKRELEGSDTTEYGRTYYLLWLYLEGGDLPYLESVTYTLHESYKPPTQTVRRTPSNPHCKLAIWAWGLFDVKATLLDKKGFTYGVTHELTFAKELPSEPDRYDYRDDEPNASSRPTRINYSS